jgi:hypothetical protein
MILLMRQMKIVMFDHFISVIGNKHAETAELWIWTLDMRDESKTQLIRNKPEQKGAHCVSGMNYWEHNRINGRALVMWNVSKT